MPRFSRINPVARIFVWLGAFGAESPKPVWIYTLQKHIHLFTELSERRLDRVLFQNRGLCTVTRNEFGQVNVTGNRELMKRSQEYPLEFGIATVKAYLKHRVSCVTQALAWRSLMLHNVDPLCCIFQEGEEAWDCAMFSLHARKNKTTKQN